MSDPDPASSRDTSASSESGRLDWRLLEILVCPACRGPLEYDYEAQELVSREAGLAYPIRDGIPIMLIDQARRLDSASPTQ